MKRPNCGIGNHAMFGKSFLSLLKWFSGYEADGLEFRIRPLNETKVSDISSSLGLSFSCFPRRSPFPSSLALVRSGARGFAHRVMRDETIKIVVSCLRMNSYRILALFLCAVLIAMTECYEAGRSTRFLCLFGAVTASLLCRLGLAAGFQLEAF